jgi:hypothetical protein
MEHMKAFAVVDMVAGKPNVDFVVTPCRGYSLAANLPGQWGLYLFSGTGAQLIALNALGNVYGIVAMTESGGVRWAELDGVIAAGVRTKMNTWLTARGYANIPAGWTYRQVVEAIYQRMGQNFDLNGVDVIDT